MKLLDIIKPTRPHPTHRALPLAALALATAFGLNSAQASIVWDTATNTTADTDVVTEGTLVRAVAGSFTAGNGATVNGVEFTPYASTASNPYSYSGYTEYNTQSWGVAGEGGWTDSLAKTTTNGWGINCREGYYSNIPPSGLTVAYKKILAGERDSGQPATMTLGGLTDGQSYLVQLWSMDPRNIGPRTMYLDGNPTTAMLTARSNGDPGQNIIGRFVAAGTEQTFTLTGAVAVTAYQLRTIDPPSADPTVEIISPADTATVFTTFTINATAGDLDGTITSVTFSYSGDAGVTWTQLAEDTEVPYSYTWSSAPAGDYQLKAVAVDNEAHSTTSAVVHVTVADNAPTVAITSPVDAGYAAPDFTIRATATDDGAITQVDFYDGATLLGTDDTPPYTWAVTGAELGAHVLTAKAFDNGSHEITSAAVNVTVVTPVAIVWETPAQDSALDTDVVTEGTLVRAVAGSPNAGNGATVNGVEFTPYASTSSDPYSYNGTEYNTLSWGVPGAGGWTDSLAKTTTNTWGLNSRNGWPANIPPSGLSAAYQQILRGVRDSGGAPVTMTLGGLTVGQSYLVQLWAMDARGSANGMPLTTMYLDGDPNTAMLTNRGTSGDPGQYIIGRFVANSTEQSFTLTGSVGVNAYQLREVSAPPAGGYDAWAGSPDGYGLTGDNALRGADPEGDGFTNLQEFLFGTSPVAGNGSLVTSETVGGDLVLHWLQRASGSGYLLQESITMGAGDWSTSAIVPALDADQGGVPTGYVRYKAVITTGESRKFFRMEGTEN